MSEFNLVVCVLIALMLPHLSADSVSTLEQIILQFLFLAMGYAGFKTYKL